MPDCEIWNWPPSKSCNCPEGRLLPENSEPAESAQSDPSAPAVRKVFLTVAAPAAFRETILSPNQNAFTRRQSLTRAVRCCQPLVAPKRRHDEL